MIVWIWVAYLLLGWWLPWWSLSLAAASVGYFSQNKLSAFIQSFIGGFLIWFGLLMFLDFREESLVGEPLAKLVHLPNHWLLILGLSFYAGVVAMVFGYLGYWLKRCFKDQTVST